MSTPFHTHISFRLALNGVGAAFVIGIVLVIVLVVVNYFDRRAELEDSVRGVLRVAERSAAQAAQQRDEALARKVVDGLREHRFIVGARVVDQLGYVFASQGETARSGGLEEYAVTLSVPGEGEAEYGELVVVVDRAGALGPLVGRSLWLVVFGLAGLLVLGVLLYTIYQAVISRPLTAFIDAFERLDPDEPGRTRLPVASDHQRDELGLLSRTANKFLQTSQEHLAQRKRAEGALTEREQRLQSVAENIPGIVYQRVRYPDGRFVFSYVSAGIQRLHGLKPDDVVAQRSHLLDIVHPDDREPYLTALNESAERLTPLNMEVRHIDPDGNTIWIQSMSRPYRLSSGAVVWNGVDLDITERKRAEERIQHLAHYDVLTGLPNRESFTEHLRRTIAVTERTRHMFSVSQRDGRPVAVSERTGREFTLSRRLGLGRMFAVLFLDLDDFKSVNDTLGHGVGDLLLKAVAQRLQNHMRASDALARYGSATVSRFGGDEFAIVLNNLVDADGAATAAQRIVETLSQPFDIEGNQIYTGSSIGIAIYPDDGETPEQLLKNADMAMYQSKADKVSKYHFYVPEMDAEVSARKSLESDLREALERNELWLCYQPQVEVESGAISSCEALLRWRHPERGDVSPATLIPAAEHTNLIIPIGEWVLREACAQVKAWLAADLPPVAVTVNLSAVQIEYQDVLAMVESALREIEVDPSMLHIEVTESAVMQNFDTALETLHGLRKMGVKVYLDDFGTGYSSLSYLQRFPIDTLKIDQTFVRGVTVNPDDASIARAIINMAHSLNMRVTAEGVETAAQFEFLRDEGCNVVQGHYFSRAVPAEDFAQLLSRGGFSADGRLRSAG